MGPSRIQRTTVLTSMDQSKRWPNLWAIMGGTMLDQDFTDEQLAAYDKAEKTANDNFDDFLVFLTTLVGAARGRKS